MGKMPQLLHIQDRKDLVGALQLCFFNKQNGKSASGSNQGAIDNRIEQAMDLVKSHLMNAVRSEVEELKEKIVKLEETISNQAQELSRQQNDFNREVGRLQAENDFLRRNVDPDVLVQWNNNVQQQQPPQQQPQQQNQEQQRQNTQQPPQPPPQH